MFFAVRTSSLINGQILASADEVGFEAINKSRKTAMNNVWLLSIWLSVTAVESFTYSLFLLINANDECAPRDDHNMRHDLLKFMDRMTNYEFWLIPLIWLYWPTKAHKRENRFRKKAIDQLKQPYASASGNLDETRPSDNTDDLSDNGYSSLDGGESYLDYDNRTDGSSFVGVKPQHKKDRTTMMENSGSVVDQYTSDSYRNTKSSHNNSNGIVIVGQRSHVLSQMEEIKDMAATFLAPSDPNKTPTQRLMSNDSFSLNLQ